MYGFYQTLKEMHVMCGDADFSKKFPYASFKWAWYSFLELVSESIDFKEGFSCPDCGSHPDKVLGFMMILIIH